jgi:hypothetical protein
MPLWGVEDTAAAKPQIGGRAHNAEKAREIYATTQGWVQAAQGNDSATATPELLVAIRGLTTRTAADRGFGGAAHGAADLTSINWNISTWDVSAGGTLSVTANFNEAVVVTGTPKLVVTNGNQGSGSGRGPHNLTYASGSGTNRLTFTLVIAAANAAIAAGDVLVIGANAVAQVGGSTIKDSVGAATSTITNSSGVGTAAGSITAVA